MQYERHPSPEHVAPPSTPPGLKTLFRRPDTIGYPLYCVCPVINASRFRSRWKLFEDFRRHVAISGSILVTVEVAFGDRAFVVTSPDNAYDLQLRSFHELWLKERAINLGVAHLTKLHPDWRAVAWLDGDFEFARPDWANETLHVLQHYACAQLWSVLVNLTSDFEIKSTLVSFMAMQEKKTRDEITDEQTHAKHCDYDYDDGGDKQQHGSPGLAWAMRREMWDQLPGGIIDFTILGAGDQYFASCLVGEIDEMIKSRNDLSGPFMERIRKYYEHLLRTRWEERCLVKNIGLMKGAVMHFFHGHRINRGYRTRGEILMRHEFDPDRDLKADASGLYQLTDRSPALRKELQMYFAARLEDDPS